MTGLFRGFTVCPYGLSLAPEILFACHSHTTQPLNGLPFYQILDDQLTYNMAQNECWQLGAELLTLKRHDQLILTQPTRLVWYALRIDGYSSGR